MPNCSSRKREAVGRSGSRVVSGSRTGAWPALVHSNSTLLLVGLRVIRHRASPIDRTVEIRVQALTAGMALRNGTGPKARNIVSVPVDLPDRLSPSIDTQCAFRRRSVCWSAVSNCWESTMTTGNGRPPS